MSTPEGIVKKSIQNLLERYRIYPAKKAGAFPTDAVGWYYMPVQHFSVKGIPDYMGHYYNHFWAIEAKALGKKPTGFQQLQIDAIKESGGSVFVVDGQESLEVFDAWLCEIGRQEHKKGKICTSSAICVVKSCRHNTTHERRPDCGTECSIILGIPGSTCIDR